MTILDPRLQRETKTGGGLGAGKKNQNKERVFTTSPSRARKTTSTPGEEINGGKEVGRDRTGRFPTT